MCIRDRVNIDNVSFQYPGSKNYALRNVSLFIENGQKIAIVGANGSGKTTLVKLICGLYDVTKGSIKINDTCLLYTSTKIRPLWYCSWSAYAFIF